MGRFEHALIHQVAKPDVIYCVGEAMKEVFLPFKGFPTSDSTLVWNSLAIELGGPALNVAWHCSQLGLNTIPACTVGAGELAAARATIGRMGLPADHLVALQEETDILFSFLEGAHHYSFYLKGGFRTAPKKEHLPPFNERSLVVLSGGRHVSIQKLFVDIVKTRQRCKVLFNPSYATYEYEDETLREILEASDFVFLNAQEAAYVSSRLDVSDIAHIAERRPGIFISMLGESGVQAYGAKESFELPSVAKQVANSIGGGDALVAGFAYSMVQGGSLSEALKIGSALAAIVVEDPRIRPAVALADVQRRLRSFGDA